MGECIDINVTKQFNNTKGWYSTMALSIDQFKVDQKKASKEDLDKALELLAKQRFTAERVKKGEIKGSYFKKVGDMTPEQQKVYRTRQARTLAKNAIFMKKAKAAGISVTDVEVDAYIKSKEAAPKAA